MLFNLTVNRNTTKLVCLPWHLWWLSSTGTSAVCKNVNAFLQWAYSPNLQNEFLKLPAPIVPPYSWFELNQSKHIFLPSFLKMRPSWLHLNLYIRNFSPIKMHEKSWHLPKVNRSIYILFIYLSSSRTLFLQFSFLFQM
jgi:hypothetical protein